MAAFLRCPLITKGVLGAGIFGLGDAMVQLYEHRQGVKASTGAASGHGGAPGRGRTGEQASSNRGAGSADESGSGPAVATAARNRFELDAKRTASASFWRAVIFTPPAHLFYTFLDRMVKKPTRGPFRGARWWAAISLVDGLLWLPPVFSSYFATSTLLRGGTLSDAWAKVKASLLPALSFSICFWPPMHLLTFFVVPAQQRLLFVNLASIAVAFSLSYIDYFTDTTPVVLEDTGPPALGADAATVSAADGAEPIVSWEKYAPADLRERPRLLSHTLCSAASVK